MTEFIILLAQFLAVTIVLTSHEFAHAYVAYKFGDPTAKFAGRLTLNPLKHFDPLGLIAFVFAGFGWAKPVPINPNNFSDYRKGCLWTSAAGILTNYAMAFLIYPIYLLATYYLGNPTSYFSLFIIYFLYFIFACSMSFCVFNLLPVYPLDGFRILDSVNQKKGKIYWFLRKYGYYILLGLIFLGFISSKIPNFHFDILGYALNYLIKFFGWPITTLWNGLFSLIF